MFIGLFVCCVYGIGEVCFINVCCDMFFSSYCFEDFHWGPKFWSEIFMMCVGVMFCPLVSVVSRAWLPIEAELFLAF